MSNIILEIPEIKKAFFSEVFQLASQHPTISIQRKIRITNFFCDLSEQQRENHKLIYTTYSKSQIKKMLNDLKMFYRNSNQFDLLSNVDGLLKELSQ